MLAREALKVVLFLSSSAFAASGQAANESGCAILAELTRQHTVMRLEELAGESRDRSSLRVANGFGLQVCHETAGYVSEGYSKAMAQFGMTVHWGAIAAGARCPYADISQCRPTADSAGAPLTIGSTSLMLDTWREVRDGLAVLMAAGPTSNVSCFSSRSLLSAFRSSELMKAGSIVIEPAFGLAF